MGLTVSPLFFYNDGFGINQPTKVDMSLNKENQLFLFYIWIASPLWSEVVLPVNVSSMSQIELFNQLTVRKQITGVKLNC